MWLAKSLLHVVRYRCAGKFRRGVAAADEKPLQISVLEEGGFWPLLTTDSQNPGTILILKMGMNIGQEDVADPILDQVYQMQAELVLVLESIGIKTQDFPVVCDPDQQR